MTKNTNATGKELKAITFKAVKAIFGAVAVNSVRYFLNGMLIDHERGCLVATDGHILACVSGCVAKTGNKSDNRWVSPLQIKKLAIAAAARDAITFPAPGRITIKSAKHGVAEFTELEKDSQAVDYANAFPNYRRVMTVEKPEDEFTWFNPTFLYTWQKIAEALDWNDLQNVDVTPGGRSHSTRIHLPGCAYSTPDKGIIFDFFIMPITNEPLMVPVKEGK